MSEGDGSFYHVRVTLKSDRTFDEVKLDLTRDMLIERFIEPYESGNPIITSGKTIDVLDIERLKINRTNSPSKTLIPIIRDRRRASKSIVLGISNEWYVTEEGEDVTDDFIKGSPGYKMETLRMIDSTSNLQIQKSDKIFIVHGHDEEMKQTVARTVEKLDLKPIILHEQANGGKTIIEKFEAHSSDVSFAIVLLSPDDKGCTVNSFPDEVKFRARQNVILELGYFIGKLGRDRVFVLHKSSNDFELPSDIMGVLYTPYIEGWNFKLVKELQACGYDKADANKIV
jgi:predicted nucleotide-binding protein